jgi:hypothetical protein
MIAATEVVLGIAALAFALALIVYGRRFSYTAFMQTGVVTATYPAIVIVFVALGCGLLITGLR